MLLSKEQLKAKKTYEPNSIVIADLRQNRVEKGRRGRVLTKKKQEREARGEEERSPQRRNLWKKPCRLSLERERIVRFADRVTY